MKRQDFKTIIKLRSFHRIDKRVGDYELPSGEYLSSYIIKLIWQQMELDKIAINSKGDLSCWIEGGNFDKGKNTFTDYKLINIFGHDENCNYDTMLKRVYNLAKEIVERKRK